MKREAVQRGTLTGLWKRMGMQPEDIGVYGDIDEVFSRDFLRAVQVCDVPQFRPNIDETGYDCKRPKVIANTIPFEGSPECRSSHSWFHPDLMLGHCIERIGDPSVVLCPFLRNITSLLLIISILATYM
jgi:hypothetical protein